MYLPDMSIIKKIRKVICILPLSMVFIHCHPVVIYWLACDCKVVFKFQFSFSFLCGVFFVYFFLSFVLIFLLRNEHFLFRLNIKRFMHALSSVINSNVLALCNFWRKRHNLSEHACSVSLTTYHLSNHEAVRGETREQLEYKTD